MKFKFFIIILLLTSCNVSTLHKEKFTPYSSSGFALIYNKEDYTNKTIARKLDQNTMQVAHNKLKTNTIVRIRNPENNKLFVPFDKRGIATYYKNTILHFFCVDEILELGKNSYQNG